MTNKAKQKADAATARREYQRAWRAANKDKVKAIQERYWIKKANQLQQQEAE